MSDRIKEIIKALRDPETFCEGCNHHGEPNGCNMNGIGCKAWDYAQEAADLLESLQRETEPVPRTIFGYDEHRLALIATLLQQHGVTPEDIKRAADNFMEASRIATQAIAQSLDESMRKRFGATEPKGEPHD